MSKNLPDNLSRPLADNARKEWDRIFKPRGPMLGGETYQKSEADESPTPKKAK